MLKLIFWNLVRQSKRCAPSTLRFPQTNHITLTLYIRLDTDTHLWSLSVVAIGLLQEQNSLSEMVGWERGSWGYHSDDGSIMTANELLGTGKTFGPGQTVGLTVDAVRHRAAFSLDGEPVGKFVYL